MRGKNNPSLTQRYIYFSLTLIQIKIIAKTFEQGRDFWQVSFLRNTTKDEGNVTNAIASIRVNNPFQKPFPVNNPFPAKDTI